MYLYISIIDINMSSKKLGLTGLLIALLVALPLFVFSFTNMNFDIREKAAPSTTLLISPNYQDLNPSQDFNLTVGIDSGENVVTGIDVELVFDPKIMQVTEIIPTTAIANLNNIIKKEIDNTNGKLRFATFTSNNSNGIKGNFAILNLTSKTLDSAINGNYKVSFTNLTTVAAVGEGVNVVNNLTEGNINIVSPVGGLPNSCGGTCGSNDNCQANFFCFQGYCRNPSCPTHLDCNCTVAQTATPKPTNKPTAKPVVIKTTLKPSPTVISDPKGGDIDYSDVIVDEPLPQTTLDNNIDFNNNDLPTVTTDDLKNEASSNFVKYTISIFILLLILIISYLLWKRYKNNIPHIMPPTNI